MHIPKLNNGSMQIDLPIISLQKQVGCFNDRVVPWLQTNWRDSGYERFALVLRLIAKGTAAQFIIQPQYTENPIFVVPSPGYKFLTATLKCICNDSFTDVLRVVSVLWFNELGSYLLSCLMELVSASGLPNFLLLAVWKSGDTLLHNLTSR